MYPRARLFVVCLVAGLWTGCNDAAGPRQQVADAITAAFGPALQTQVAFMRDSTHLLIQVDTTPFAKLSDAAFDAVARRIAALALREYSQVDVVDSITVTTVYAPSPVELRSAQADTFGERIYRPPPPPRRKGPISIVQVQRTRTYPVPLPPQ